ncbi:MAG: hypothetical protein WDO13_08010 [Verrucomicrobiota bacterium]
MKRAEAFVVAREAARQSVLGPGILNVPILKDAPTPALDGKLDAWTNAVWVPIDHRACEPTLTRARSPTT